MSWLENIETPLKITTGDGKEFSPNWVNARKTVGFNLAQFEFPNIDGTLVKRNRPKGSKYELEIYFQGEDHLIESKDFELSARDPRYWLIVHPYYGELKVHPLELLFDNSGHNLTKITGTVLETIVDVFPKGSVSQKDQIDEQKSELDESGSQQYAADNPSPDAKDKALMSDTVDDQNKRTGRSISDSIQAADFRDKTNAANRAITNATSDPLAAMRAIDDVLNYPAQLQNSITARLDAVTDAFTGLVNKIGNSPQTIPASQKRFHEKALTSNVSAMATAVTNPGGGGSTSRSQALGMTQKIINTFNTYVETLDSMQNGTGGTLTSYVPNQDSLKRTEQLINFVVSEFLAITLTEKQEHKFIVDAETNALLLTHRFYGLDEEDENLTTFIETNNIGLDEMLLIKKGREVVYFV